MLVNIIGLRGENVRWYDFMWMKISFHPLVPVDPSNLKVGIYSKMEKVRQHYEY